MINKSTVNTLDTAPTLYKEVLRSEWDKVQATIEQQAREIERLNDRYRRDVYGLNNEGDPIGGEPAGGYANDNVRLRAELAALRAQQPGVMLPERKSADPVFPYDRGFNACLDEVARLNSSPVSAELIRFDFTNAQGQPDSKMVTHDEMRQRYSDLLISNALALGGGSTVSAGGVDERSGVVLPERKPVSAGGAGSVPEVTGVGRDADQSRALMIYLRAEPTDDDIRAIHNALRAALTASAPYHSEQVREPARLVECDRCPTSGGCVEVCMRASAPGKGGAE